MRRVRTDANPIKVDGVLFCEWNVGIFTRAWISEDDRAAVRYSGIGKAYTALVDGELVGTYETRHKAMKAAVAALQ